MAYSSDLLDNHVSVTETTFIAAPQYPSLFGITLSPQILGAAIGVLGCGIGGYLFMNYVQPQLTKNQELSAKLADTEKQIEMRKDNASKIAAIEAERGKIQAQKQTILALFANDKKLDTLLLDLNKLVKIRQGELKSFTPDGNGTATMVVDGSFGAALNGKLKRKSIKIDLEGNFEQVQSILRTIERLDQLLIVKNFQISADSAKEVENIGSEGKSATVPRDVKLKTTFELQAIIPATIEEQAAAAPPPAKK
jgi:type IV pilus assembly protein PilO